jgi:hypothetical protein
MKDEVSLTLVASTGHRVDLPLLPETLVRRRTADGSGERLELVTHLDDRLSNETAATAGILSALTELIGDVSELRWGKRRFRGNLSDLTVTETAFQEELEPIAATIQLAFDVLPKEERAVSVTVAGKRWRQVPDLDTAGPNDPVYEVHIGDDGSLKVRFGDGRRGARPPAGEVLVRALYRVGGGQAGAN